MIHQKHLRRWPLLFLFPGLLLGMLILRETSFPSGRTSGPINHELYVWQRVWDSAVQDALAQVQALTTGLVVLAAEVSWRGERPKVTKTQIDYELLQQLHVPVALAVRIGPYAGQEEQYKHHAAFLAALCETIVREADANGLRPHELQVDFDCPESKLDAYGSWIDAIQRHVAPIRITITALPCWLRHDTFGRLVRRTDGYVLQVHSLDPPATAEGTFTLCDVEAASQWIDHAARFGVPFRIALPTYGYVAVFDTQGAFMSLLAEGPLPSWDSGFNLRDVRADPMAMAGLVAHLQLSRPTLMEGIIWYRMPTRHDRLNWNWPTLTAVMKSKAPRSVLQIKAEKREPCLVDIQLVNTGQVGISPRVSVAVQWAPGILVASDALGHFEINRLDEHSIVFSGAQALSLCTIWPGERWPVGWLRFTDDTEVEVDLDYDNQ